MHSPMTKRPISVTVVAWLYIVTGAAGLALQLANWRTARLLSFDTSGVASIRALAIVAGVFLLLRHNWARWLAVAWMAFHMWVGFLNSVRQGIAHSVFLILIVWLLFRPAASAWFRRSDPAPPAV